MRRISMAEVLKPRFELESFSGAGGFGFRDRRSGAVVIEPQYDAVLMDPNGAWVQQGE
jgi:hypothetical protein